MRDLENFLQVGDKMAISGRSIYEPDKSEAIEDDKVKNIMMGFHMTDIYAYDVYCKTKWVRLYCGER